MKGSRPRSVTSGFNPTLVRLRRFTSKTTSGWSVGFQSHAGSIEAAERERTGGFCILFQSHAGSIEAENSTGRMGSFFSFQSHAGSIEAA